MLDWLPGSALSYNPDPRKMKVFIGFIKFELIQISCLENLVFYNFLYFYSFTVYNLADFGFL